MEPKGIHEAVACRREVVKRLLYLAALFVLVFLIFAPAALAQSGGLESQGITQPCPFQLDRFPEGTVCGEGGAYIDPEDGTAAEPLPVGENPEEDEGDNVDPDTGEVVGDDTPDCERSEDVLESGLCRSSDEQEAADGETPAGEVSVGEGSEEEKTRRERRERRERTVGEESGGGAQEQPADEGGETPGSDGGGSGEGGEASEASSSEGGGSEGGSGEGGAASQGGVSGAVSDGFGSVLSGRLPDTGGGWAVLLVAGAVLIGGGVFLVRRFSSSA